MSEFNEHNIVSGVTAALRDVTDEQLKAELARRKRARRRQQTPPTVPPVHTAPTEEPAQNPPPMPVHQTTVHPAAHSDLPTSTPVHNAPQQTPPTRLPPPLPDADVSIVIDAHRKYQIIDGFGATFSNLQAGRVTQYYAGKTNLTDEQRTAANKVIFQTAGINLGFLNMPQTQRGKGRFDFSEMEFTYNKLVKDNPTFDYSIAPNLDYRPNGMDWMIAERAANYPNYLNLCAEHIVKSCQRWREISGAYPKTFQLVNEPTSGNGELQGSGTFELRDIVKTAGRALRTAGINTKFILPNEGDESTSLQMAEVVLSDAENAQYVYAIGFHQYPYYEGYASTIKILSNSSDLIGRRAIVGRLRELANRFSLKLWMTEVSNGEAGRDSFDLLRARAIHIHDIFKVGCNAFFGMLAQWDTKTHQEHTGGSRSFLTENENIAAIYTDTGEIAVSGTGYAIAHYARAVKRGMSLIDSSASDASVFCSAFAGEGSAAFVLVNNSDRAKTVFVSAQNQTLPDALRVLTSTNATRLVETKFENFNTTGFPVTLPALSVVSVYSEQ